MPSTLGSDNAFVKHARLALVELPAELPGSPPFSPLRVLDGHTDVEDRHRLRRPMAPSTNPTGLRCWTTTARLLALACRSSLQTCRLSGRSAQEPDPPTRLHP